MFKLTINNVHQYAKELYKYNKEQGYTLTYADCIAYAFQLYRNKRYDDLKALKNIDKQDNKQQASNNNDNNDYATLDDIILITSNDYLTEDEVNVLNNMIIDRVDYKNDDYFIIREPLTKTRLKQFYSEFESAKSKKQLQAITLTYILDQRLKASIRKLLEMGHYYKDIERSEIFVSEESARSFFYSTISDGKKPSVEYDIDDIFNIVIYDSLRLDFKLFTPYHYNVLFLRSRNAVRTQFNRNKKISVVNQATLTKNNDVEESDNIFDYIINKERSSYEERHGEWTHQERDIHYYGLIDQLKDAIGLTNFEVEIQKFLLRNSKKELYKKYGRIDRKVTALEKKLANYLGKDLKEYRKEFTSTKRSLV